MVCVMWTRADRRPLASMPTALLLVAIAACGGSPPADPGNREVAWSYGPTKGGATAEHVAGTGSEGGSAIAKGWQCRLQDGKFLTVQPYQLAPSHALFGKVTLSVGLFDKTGKQLGTLRSPVITAANATFTLELAADVADQLWDVVFWYRKA